MIDCIPITDLDQWLELRLNDVTSTGAAALLGADEYQTALHLYYVKRREIKEESDEPIITEDEISLSPMGRGLLMEDPAEKLLRLLKPDWQVQKNKCYYRDAELRIGATPDLLVVDPNRGIGNVEVKNPQGTYRKWFQEDGSVQPPLNYIIQANIGAYLTGASWAAIGAFMVSHRTTFRLIDIPIHQGILDRVKFEVAEFWRRVEEGRPYPADWNRDGALIAQLYPQDSGIEIDLSGDNAAPLLVDQLEAARAAKKTAEADEKNAKTGIAEKMGEAAIALLADGRRISFKTQHRAGYVVEDGTTRPIRILKGQS